MGLDCHVFTAKKVNKDEKGIITNLSHDEQIAYWRKCWWLHEKIADFYRETVDDSEFEFSCVYVELPLWLIEDLFEEMIYDLSLQNLPNESDITDRLYSQDVDELKKVLNFKKNNPETSVYYYGWY